MNPRHAPIALLRTLLARLGRANGGGDAPAPEHAEYDDLLRAVGGRRDEAPAADLRDLAIAELQATLEELRPLGERLAESERARLAGEAEVARLSAALEARTAEIEELRGTLEKQGAARARAEERAVAWREKRDERHRVAAERWREIRALRGERKRLERELEKQRRLWAQLEEPLRRIAEEAGELDAKELRALAEPWLAERESTTPLTAPSSRRGGG